MKNIVLDLVHLKRINSHGIGELMASYSSVQSVKGQIGLARTSDQVMQILNISKVNRLFLAFDSVDTAVSQFSKS